MIPTYSITGLPVRTERKNFCQYDTEATLHCVRGERNRHKVEPDNITALKHPLKVGSFTGRKDWAAAVNIHLIRRNKVGKKESMREVKLHDEKGSNCVDLNKITIVVWMDDGENERVI